MNSNCIYHQTDSDEIFLQDGQWTIKLCMYLVICCTESVFARMMKSRLHLRVGNVRTYPVSVWSLESFQKSLPANSHKNASIHYGHACRWLYTQSIQRLRAMYRFPDRPLYFEVGIKIKKLSFMHDKKSVFVSSRGQKARSKIIPDLSRRMIWFETLLF